MTPVAPPLDMADKTARDPVFSSQRCRPISQRQPRHDCLNLLRCQLGSRVFVPLRITHLRHLVRIVGDNGSYEQMRGLRARRIVARMQGALRLRKRTANLHLEHESVDANPFIIEGEVAIPVFVPRACENKAIALGSNMIQHANGRGRESADGRAELTGAFSACLKRRSARGALRGMILPHQGYSWCQSRGVSAPPGRFALQGL